MSSINYSDKIPNNVNLSEDRTLQRALEQWQPNYLQWWNDMGPDGSQNFDVYLRTAVSVDPQGWAQFGHVKMPDYRWGIFLNPAEQDRKIHFGDHMGENAWQDIPGEYRANLRRIIVTQGDTEPASVEQQRHLGLTAPSQYDLRNLFQVNVEEGRHLWAMVYLLHKYFGRDGREEGEAEDNSRGILGVSARIGLCEIRLYRARSGRHRASRGRGAGDVRRGDARAGVDGTVAVQPRHYRDGGGRGAEPCDVRRRAVAGDLRQDRAGPADRRAALRPYPGHLRAGRSDDLGPIE